MRDLFNNLINVNDRVDLYGLIGKRYISKDFFTGTKTIVQFGHLGKTPVAYFKEGGGAHSLQAIVKHTGRMIYPCRLRSRKQMDKIFKSHEKGWWYSVCPSRKLYLQQAIKEDLNRCILNLGTSSDPKDYMVEVFDGGALVNKKAIKYIEMDIKNIKM